MPSTPTREFADLAIELCLREGFAEAGVCTARPSDRPEAFEAWLGDGQHGGMGWLADTARERLDPAVMAPWARSVIVALDLYAHDASDPAPLEPGQGRVARYAHGRDYHKEVKKRLFRVADALRERAPEAKFRACVDTAPIHEREHAERAGLGWVGKHTLLIHPRLGSYFFLGAILPDLPMTETRPRVADHCGSCTRCIDACPTDAITPYSVDARRCISYLTIEHRDTIGEQLAPGVGEWLFGCDVCQDVCPHNAGVKRRPDDPIAKPVYADDSRAALDALGVLDWDENDRRRAMRGSAMKRASLWMMRRNALIVLGNLAHGAGAGLSGQQRDRARERADEIVQDSEERDAVRAAAAWVAMRLAASDPPDR